LATNSNKAAESLGPKLKLKSMMWLKPMATKPYSRAFQNKTGLHGFAWKWYADDYYKKRILIILHRKNQL
jgi:hypothetical protein